VECAAAGGRMRPPLAAPRFIKASGGRSRVDGRLPGPTPPAASAVFWTALSRRLGGRPERRTGVAPTPLDASFNALSDGLASVVFR